MLNNRLYSAQGNIGIYLVFLIFVFFGLLFFVAGMVFLILDLSTESGDSPLIIGLAFAGFGLLFALIGLIPMLLIRRGKRKAKDLLANGRCISAKLIEAYQNTSVSVNGRHPFIILCQWVDPSGQLQEFKSEYLWTNPYYIIDEMNLKTMDVYLDENNPKRYYVDVRRLKPRR